MVHSGVWLLAMIGVVVCVSAARPKHGGVSALGRSFCFDKPDCQDVCRGKCGLYRVKQLKCARKNSKCQCKCRKECAGDTCSSEYAMQEPDDLKWEPSYQEQSQVFQNGK